MQKPQRSCPQCAARMEQGFLVDIITPGSAVLQPQGEQLLWARGPRSALRQPRWFSRLMSGLGFLIQDADTLPVTSMRCASCGFLELYANP